MKCAFAGMEIFTVLRLLWLGSVKCHGYSLKHQTSSWNFEDSIHLAGMTLYGDMKNQRGEKIYSYFASKKNSRNWPSLGENSLCFSHVWFLIKRSKWISMFCIPRSSLTYQEKSTIFSTSFRLWLLNKISVDQNGFHEYTKKIVREVISI